jgi:uncharacterized membrane protein YecN with MAPEG domain
VVWPVPLRESNNPFNPIAAKKLLRLKRDVSAMTEETEIRTAYLGEATGPTADMQQAEPWITAGFALVVFALLLYLGFSVVAIKRRTPGRWLTFSGLSIIMMYFVFQNTVAQDAELRYGPVADALSLVAYGFGGLLLAAGYAKSILQARGQLSAR